LEKPLKELKRVRLTTGVISTATLERTKDGTDYKLIVRKSTKLSPPGADLPQDAGPIELELKSANTGSELTSQAKELVSYFFKRFHKVEKSYPTSKAINQAISLISNHGVDQARYVVDFAHIAAQDTGFKIETFGGIMDYTSRAVADYDKHQKARQTQTAIDACSFCNRAGFVSLRILKDGKWSHSSAKCTHDVEQMRAVAENQGYQIV